ncbi:septum site-determining protein MinC [Lysobacter sp. HDW10]|uniref:septum site-determining protein MinC n=1 Tax=Lysobacter sp. HDW10 TaxID=2714936 RepID=UPI00140D77AE|nr:septum site-determining protein MinC [Lysobacter sp. HDW10]QIK81423.1 septum site-determining protein MinC [Lysobacter sp. HDW10]
MTLPDYSLAGDVKFGQVGIANLRLRTFDIEKLAQEMRDRVQRAPKLFERGAVIVDFGGLAELPTVDQAGSLIEALRREGVRPVAIAYGSHENDVLAQALGLPTLAKFRASYERAGEAPELPPAPAPAPARSAAKAPAAQPPQAESKSQEGLVITHPVRSGQQVYAEHRDLTVVGMISMDAEVMADGSVHVYGPLRGRALAGARGDTTSRIFCNEFNAQLVAIAGHYIVLDEVPDTLIGKAVQVWLENDKIQIAAL